MHVFSVSKSNLKLQVTTKNATRIHSEIARTGVLTSSA